MVANVEEFDSVTFVGKANIPWHQTNCVEVPPNTPLMEVARLSKQDWLMEKRKLFREVGQDYKEVLGQIAIVRTDIDHVLGFATEGYQLYQNKDGFRALQPFIDSGLARIETTGTLKNGKIVWALLRINTEDLIINGKDVLRRYVLASWGNDGKTGIRVGYVDVRVVCWNTLTAAHSSGLSKLIRMSHKGDVVSNVDSVIATMDLTVQEFRTTADNYKRMLDKRINAHDLREYVRVTLGLVEKNDNKKATNLIDRVVDTAYMGYGIGEAANTVWGAFNGMTQYLSHNATRNPDNRLASLWFGQNSNMLKTAYDNAMKMVA